MVNGFLESSNFSPELVFALTRMSNVFPTPLEKGATQKSDKKG
jgi:hypothetical protein